MFLVPASILFTALGVATTEALKTLLSIKGLKEAMVSDGRKTPRERVSEGLRARTAAGRGCRSSS
jgi:hypothetical protein